MPTRTLPLIHTSRLQVRENQRDNGRRGASSWIDSSIDCVADAKDISLLYHLWISPLKLMHACRGQSRTLPALAGASFDLNASFDNVPKLLVQGEQFW